MHTPGPWIASEAGPDSLAEIRSASSTTPVVNWQGFDDCFREDDEHNANARLIAAAPDLLAACKVALEYLAPVCISSQAIPNMLRAAIAKAEGRT
jgi:hypothetical protein